MGEKLILVRKPKQYDPKSKNPKVSTDRRTYETLKRLALDNGMTISEVLRQIVEYADEHMGGTVEE